MKKIHGTALVTGASTGIGKEIAELLASRGCDLVITSRRAEVLEQNKKDWETRFGVKVTVMAADLSVIGESEKLHDRCRELKLPVNILVNNAGLGLFGSALELEPAKVSALITLNINALTLLCTLFGADFKAAGSGWILNIGSLIGHFSTPWFASYSSSKAYVRQFSRALKNELKGTGVNLTCVEPGFVKTGFDDHSGIKAEKYRKNSESMGMTPDKVARIAVRALFAKKTIVVAGFGNKIGALMSRMLPEWMTTALFGAQIKKMTE
jgi:short-subunit dehydrogenase